MKIDKFRLGSNQQYSSIVSHNGLAPTVVLNENVWISINISLKFLPKDPMNTILALLHRMAWPRPGD